VGNLLLSFSPSVAPTATPAFAKLRDAGLSQRRVSSTILVCRLLDRFPQRQAAQQKFIHSIRDGTFVCELFEGGPLLAGRATRPALRLVLAPQYFSDPSPTLSIRGEDCSRLDRGDERTPWILAPLERKPEPEQRAVLGGESRPLRASRRRASRLRDRQNARGWLFRHDGCLRNSSALKDRRDRRGDRRRAADPTRPSECMPNPPCGPFVEGFKDQRQLCPYCRLGETILLSC